MRKETAKCAVLFTYSFDHFSCVTLFDDFDSAAGYLKAAFEDEVRVEEEENGWYVTATHEDDWSYAVIDHEGELCEYRVCTSVWEGEENELDRETGRSSEIV